MTSMMLLTIAGALLAGLLLGAVLGDLRRRNRAQAEMQAARLEARAVEVKLDAANHREQALAGELAALRARNQQLDTDNARLATRLEEQARINDEKLKLLESAREQLSLQFKQLADSIFEHKQQSFNQTSKQALESMLTPFRDQLKEFRSRVDSIYDQETRDRSSLREQLSQLHQMNQRMSEEALNLTRALKGDSKTRGNWGEVILTLFPYTTLFRSYTLSLHDALPNRKSVVKGRSEERRVGKECTIWNGVSLLLVSTVLSFTSSISLGVM